MGGVWGGGEEEDMMITYFASFSAVILNKQTAGTLQLSLINFNVYRYVFLFNERQRMYNHEFFQVSLYPSLYAVVIFEAKANLIFPLKKNKHGFSNKRAMMALGRSPEYHCNQIISKSVHRFSRRSRFKLFSIYRAGNHFVQQSQMV